MTKLHKVERRLDKIFNESFPDLPTDTKKFIVKYVPWLSLAAGLLSIWSAWDLWNSAHSVNTVVSYANNIGVTYSQPRIITTTNQVTIGVWLGVILILIEAILYIAAYRGLVAQKKSGWNLIFYGLGVNIVYGLVLAFTNYGGFGTFLSYLIVSFIGLYLIFQIRSAYIPKAKRK
jgi:hypothetical protein